MAAAGQCRVSRFGVGVRQGRGLQQLAAVIILGLDGSITSATRRHSPHQDVRCEERSEQSGTGRSRLDQAILHRHQEVCMHARRPNVPTRSRAPTHRRALRYYILNYDYVEDIMEKR